MAQAEEFIKILRPYTVIVVVDGKIGAFGGVTYTPEAAIRDSIQIKDSKRDRYRPFVKVRSMPILRVYYR